MCGRFTLRANPAELVEIFELTRLPEISPRYNIAPTQPVLVVRLDRGFRVPSLLRWGLVPHWAKDLSIGARAINARSETVHEKPMFRQAFERRRCLIPADGYYEWIPGEEGGKRQPLFHHLADDRPFAFAGLWDSWDSLEGETVETCTILTTTPNDVVAQFHDRMPVILPEDHWTTWLSSSESSGADIRGLLVPADPTGWKITPVGFAVNRATCEGPVCLSVPSNTPQTPPGQFNFDA
ncbi:MAG: SOS response-associated peptidase [Planctomycetaceae bacterium]|nr:SOS response-associated peptidase [Planctomycetaceae bacterium]